MSILAVLVVLGVAAVIVWLVNRKMDLTPGWRLGANVVIAVLLLLFLWSILGGDTGFLSRRV